VHAKHTHHTSHRNPIRSLYWRSKGAVSPLGIGRSAGHMSGQALWSAAS
jgi:hypothetical protein